MTTENCTNLFIGVILAGLLAGCKGFLDFSYYRWADAGTVATMKW